MTVRVRIVPVFLVLLGAALLAGASRETSAQQTQFDLIKVAQLDFLLKKSAKVQIIDVRSRQEYLTRHIKGAVSIPLDTIELRTGEVPRQGLVVLY
jgi:3-mercaptopyruvate sulfurtransferase SseA